MANLYINYEQPYHHTITKCYKDNSKQDLQCLGLTPQTSEQNKLKTSTNAFFFFTHLCQCPRYGKMLLSKGRTTKIFGRMHYIDKDTGGKNPNHKSKSNIYTHTYIHTYN